MKKFELVLREVATKEKTQSKPISNPADAMQITENLTGLSTQAEEHLVALFVNVKLHVIGWTSYSGGFTDQAGINLGSIMKRALLSNCEGIVILHNHPSTNLGFSPADKKMNKAIDKACQLLGLRLIDFLVVSQGEGESILSADNRFHFIPKTFGGITNE